MFQVIAVDVAELGVSLAYTMRLKYYFSTTTSVLLLSRATKCVSTDFPCLAAVPTLI
jgi:hypothetical protein